MSARPAGFTLIELLVVLLIVGLTLAMVSLSVDSGNRARQLTDSAQLLAREAAIYLQEAEADGRARGLALARLGVGRWGWRWYREQDSAWRVDPESDNVAQLPEGIEPRLRVEGKELELSSRSVSDTDVVPDIVFYASGEVSPFTLFFGDSADAALSSITLCGDAIGGISLHVDTEPTTEPCQVSGS